MIGLEKLWDGVVDAGGFARDLFTCRLEWPGEPGSRAADLRDVRSFCLFIGYPRSGHSLIGALLDAHPDVVIGHEVNVLRFVRWGSGRVNLYRLIVRSSRRFAETGCIGGGDYSYRVPTQWQGRSRRLLVIGDKRGGGTSHQLRGRPGLLPKLQRLVDVPLRVIHVIRNPFDNIATLCRRDAVPLATAIDRYFNHVATVAATSDALCAGELFELRHEDFIARPAHHLRGLCRFLEVEAPQDYVSDCAAIVYRSPHQSRRDVEWPPALRAETERRMARYPFLAGYSFSDSEAGAAPPAGSS